MTKTFVTLLLLSLSLTGCIVEPGGGYNDRGYRDGGHAEFHAGYGEHGSWNN